MCPHTTVYAGEHPRLPAVQGQTDVSNPGHSHTDTSICEPLQTYPAAAAAAAAAAANAAAHDGKSAFA
jgi:hypothetical protein